MTLCSKHLAARFQSADRAAWVVVLLRPRPRVRGPSPCRRQRLYALTPRSPDRDDMTATAPTRPFTESLR